LPAGAVELRQVGLRRAGKRDGVECSRFASGGPIAVISFPRQETAGGNGNPFVVNGQRTFEAVNLLLRLLQFVHGVARNRLQVGDVVLQCTNLVGTRRALRVSGGGLLRLCCCRLRLGYLLLQLLNRLVPALDLLLQLLYLLLLSGNGVFHVLERFRNRSGTAVAASLRFRTRGLGLCDNARRDQNRERKG